MRPDRWAARLVHEVTLVLQVLMAQPVHKVRRELWVPLVQRASGEARVTPDLKVRLVRRVTTARLVLGVRLVRLATPDTPDTPDTPATGVRRVRWANKVQLVRRVTPAIQVQPVLWVTLELLVFTAKSVSQFLLSS